MFQPAGGSFWEIVTAKLNALNHQIPEIPELNLNVEYKTSELFLGKPVYYYLWFVGSMSASSSEQLRDLPSIVSTNLKDGCGCKILSKTNNGSFRAINGYGGVSFPKYDNATKISFSNAPWSTGDMYVLLKYTKTTD